jgi:hypothetical protein
MEFNVEREIKDKKKKDMTTDAHLEVCLKHSSSYRRRGVKTIQTSPQNAGFGDQMTPHMLVKFF